MLEGKKAGEAEVAREKKKIAKKLKLDGMSDEKISQITGLSKKEIADLS